MNDEAIKGHRCALTGSVCDASAHEPAHNAPSFDRRTMLSYAMFATAAAALAACGVADLPTSPGSISPFTLKLSDYSTLTAVGGVALVSASGSPVAVVRTATDSFVALSRICPHQGATIGFGGAGFMCPRHGAQFDLSGQWIGGQPTSNMQSYAVRYDAVGGTLSVG